MASQNELQSMLNAPIALAPNTYLHFYNGGKLRAEFMGEPDPKDDYYSEEWIFSTNRAITPGRDNPPDKGLSRIELPSDEIVLLKALLDAFPEETLGSVHVDKYGTELGVLLKIFDVGEGAHIPIHWHPNPDFFKGASEFTLRQERSMDFNRHASGCESVDRLERSDRQSGIPSPDGGARCTNAAQPHARC